MTSAYDQHCAQYGQIDPEYAQAESAFEASHAAFIELWKRQSELIDLINEQFVTCTLAIFNDTVDLYPHLEKEYVAVTRLKADAWKAYRATCSAREAGLQRMYKYLDKRSEERKARKKAKGEAV